MAHGIVTTDKGQSLLAVATEKQRTCWRRCSYGHRALRSLRNNVVVIPLLLTSEIVRSRAVFTTIHEPLERFS